MMYTLGTVIAFIIVVFHIIAYYHDNKDDKGRFDLPGFIAIATIITGVATIASWFAVATYVGIRTINSLYLRFNKEV